MNVILLMVPIALILSLSFVAAFIWATKSGQWDDLDLTPKRLLAEPKNDKDATHAEK